MFDPYDSVSHTAPLTAEGVTQPLEICRRTALAGMAALITTAMTSRARADDVSIEMILNDPAAPTSGNLKGDLTIVSFFDYNCPFCKTTVEPLNAVLKSDGNIRHVFKDWPILSPTSIYGAKLALAAKYQNRYAEAYSALMAIEGGRVPEEKMRAALQAADLDFTRLEADARGKDADITALLKRNHAQAEGLGLRGTPAFVIGKFLVPSALDERGFRQVVADARKAT